NEKCIRYARSGGRSVSAIVTIAPALRSAPRNCRTPVRKGSIRSSTLRLVGNFVTHSGPLKVMAHLHPLLLAARRFRRHARRVYVVAERSVAMPSAASGQRRVRPDRQMHAFLARARTEEFGTSIIIHVGRHESAVCLQAKLAHKPDTDKRCWRGRV